jgi:predicted nucleic-acid-binding protein
MGEFNSLYVDYLGEEYSSTEKAVQGNYLMSKEKWDTVIEDLLNNRLHREIMKFQ